MGIALRQICLVSHDLEPALRDLSEVLGIEACFVDEGVSVFGLENTLLSIGRNFLEVVSPVKEGTAAGRYLARRRGDGGYMVICQTTDAETQAACRQRAADAGVRVAWEASQQTHHFMQLHPGDLQAAFLEIDWEEHGELDGYWAAAGGRAWERHVRTDRVADMTGVELQGPDPGALAALWGSVTGLPVQEERGQPFLELLNARIRFVPERDGRGPGLSGVDLAVNDRSAVLEAAHQRHALVADDTLLLCGTRFYLPEGD